MNLSELKIFFKEKLGIEKLADIARELNVSPQAMNNWKSRDRIPDKITLKIQKKYLYNNQNFRESTDQPINETVQSDYEYISFSDILYFLKRNKKTIIVTPLILCVMILFYLLLFTKPIYSSSASIIPANPENKINNMAGVAAQLGINVPGSVNQKMIYPQIIKSRTLASRMLQKKFDSIEFGKNQPFLKLLTYKNGPMNVGLDTLEIMGIESFIKMVNVKEDVKTGIVSISIEASEPQLAAKIVEVLINELDLHQKSFNTEQSVKKRIFIEERIKDVQIDLANSEESLKDFRIKNRKYTDSPSLLLEFERILREVEVQKQLYITLKQEFEMAQIKEVEESDIFHVLDKPNIPLNPIKPRIKLAVVLMAFLGVALGVIISLISNWLALQKSAKTNF